MADTCLGGGEVADIIRKLNGGDGKVVEVGRVTIGAEGKYEVRYEEVKEEGGEGVALTEANIGGEGFSHTGAQFNAGGRICVSLFDQSTELWAEAAKDQLTKKERATDTVIGLLQVYEGCIKWVTKMFCLVNEGIGDKNVIGAPTLVHSSTVRLTFRDGM